MTSAAPPQMSDTEPPLLRLGVIGDVQYANVQDGSSYSGESTRYYRNTLKVLDAAVKYWNAENVDYVVQMGDLIDGKNAGKASEAALATVFASLAKSTVPRYDLIGNHELYNWPRKDVVNVGLAHGATPWGQTVGGAESFYSSVVLGDRWEAVFMDSFEVALIGHRESHPWHKEAVTLMQQNNPGVLREGHRDWYDQIPTEKLRFTPLNGGMSPGQLDWLEKTLEAASAAGRKVIVFMHIPIYEPAASPKTMLWNATAALDIVQKYPQCVVAVIAGHHHSGGYAVDPVGIHHVTMNSPLHSTPGQECFAMLELYAGWAQFVLKGKACVETGTRGQGYPRRTPQRGPKLPRGGR